MRYLSVCSGIEAATVAWHHMGWVPAAFSEIEPFPSAVLKHHYPEVPNLGDMTRFQEWPDATVDVLVGGTPCQSFSVAGLRGGLADPRGNLMLTFGAIAQRYRPRWLVWENVPGVLSSNDGRDFGAFLGMLAELGYGFAYRVLDAQFFGVPQRRRRVFVVGCFGDWRRAAAVLFERHSLSGHPPPSRQARQRTAPGTEAGPDVCGPLYAAYATKWGNRDDFEKHKGCMYPLSPAPMTFKVRGGVEEDASGKSAGKGFLGNDDQAFTLAVSQDQWLAHPIPYDLHQVTAPVNRQSREPGDPCHTLAKENAHNASIVQPMAFHNRQDPDVSGDITHPIGAKDNGLGVQTDMQVRRLTPVECERLQGFPDNYTNIPWRKKPESPDGPRYKALGNSMAVPVMRWIGERMATTHKM